VFCKQAGGTAFEELSPLQKFQVLEYANSLVAPAILAYEEAKTRELEIEPQGDVEKMAYWANRVLSNDGALSADSSADLDWAHDELARAARSYLGVD
jgi:hypothetical protein